MNIYPNLLRPLFFMLPPATAHAWAIHYLKVERLPRKSAAPPPALEHTVFGLTFPSPIGMAAGFDKHGEVVDALLARRFGFVEAGTVTLQPQPGNPAPNLFRLAEDKALINRLGFPSVGVDAFLHNLCRQRLHGVVGVNIGKNKHSTDAAGDYCALLRKVAGLADYVTVNISSPNTPGLRDLQGKEALHALLGALMEARAPLQSRRGTTLPLLVKLSPDMDETQLDDIAETALAHGVDGLILTNTTTQRPPNLRGMHRTETGGLSGAPLMAPSTALLRAMYQRVGGRIPLVGVGGMMCGEDAYAKIRAGASLLQAYTGFVYQGLGLLRDIEHTLEARLKADGFTALQQAVGKDA